MEISSSAEPSSADHSVTFRSGTADSPAAGAGRGKTWIVRTVALLLTITLGLCRARAQNLTGEIAGTILDPTGAVIQGASVTVKNTDQNTVQRATKTNAAGDFVVTQLLPGHYLVTVKRSGFQTFTSQVEVHATATTPLRARLSVGAADVTVQVTENTNVPETETPAAESLITGAEVREIPLLNRNYEDLFLLQPGVSGDVPGSNDRGAVSSTTGDGNSANFQVNGLQAGQNAYYLDGADIQQHGGNVNVTVFPNLDGIQELVLLRNSYGAQYAGNGGGIILAETRSGSSRLHGSLYSFVQSQIFNANNTLLNAAGVPRPPIRRNDFGYTVGGPLAFRRTAHPKTYFFVAQQFLREATAAQSTLSGIPTSAQRQGIFVHKVCTSWTTAAQTACASNGSTTLITTIDPMAQAYLTDIIDKLPLPNSPTDPQGYVFAPIHVHNENGVQARVDHQFNAKLSGFARYVYDPFTEVLPNAYGQLQGAPNVGNNTAHDGGTNYLLHLTYAVTANTVIEGGFAQNRFYLRNTNTGLLTKQNSPDIQPTLPYVNTLGRVPDLSLDLNYLATGNFSGNPYRSNQGFVNVTHPVGRQTLYFGGQFETYLGQANGGGNNAGTYTFSESATPSSSTTTYEQEFAQFLIGDPNQFTQSSIDVHTGESMNQFEGYLQDNFRATHRLTLNFGLRYTLDRAPQSRPFMKQNIPLSTFVPSLYNQALAPTLTTSTMANDSDNLAGYLCIVAPCSGGVVPNPAYVFGTGMIYGNHNSPYGSAIGHTPKKDLGPRLGLVYDMTGNGRAVIRSGFGLYYSTNPPGIYSQEQNNNPPYVQTVTISYKNANCPSASFSDPAAGANPYCLAPPTIYAYPTYEVLPYVMVYNLDIQWQMWKNALLDVGYYGDVVRHLVGYVDFNQPQEGTYVTQLGYKAGIINGNNTQLLNLVRPYPGYGTIDMQWPGFSSNYNSLQARFMQRFKQRSVFNVNYTWSRALADTTQDSNSGAMNFYDIAAEYGPTLYNRKHILSTVLIYDLPAFSRFKPLVRTVLGGWEISPTVYAATGQYVTGVDGSHDPGGVGLFLTSVSNRGDQISNPNKGAPHTLKEWFNTAAFEEVPSTEARVGDTPIGSIYGPGYVVTNLGLFKNFPLPRQGVFQFRVEAFNAPNHANYTGIDTTLQGTDYGQIDAAGPPRQIQFSGKLQF